MYKGINYRFRDDFNTKQRKMQQLIECLLQSKIIQW